MWLKMTCGIFLKTLHGKSARWGGQCRGEAARSWGASSAGGFPSVGIWRGFPHERLPKGFPAKSAGRKIPSGVSEANRRLLCDLRHLSVELVLDEGFPT